MHAPTTFWSTIRHAQEGDPRAWERFYARYQKPIFRYICARIRGIADADAEDLTQTVFLQICKAGFLERADQSKGRFRNLLHAVANNIVNMWLRGEYVRRREVQRLENEEGTFSTSEGIANPAVDPSRSFDREWAHHVMEGALEALQRESDRLGTPYYEAVRAYFLEGKTRAEIAQVLGTSEMEVGNYLSRGKGKLRSSLRAFIREYCSSAEEFEDELRGLQEYLPASP